MTIGDYDMVITPQSMFAPDGSLLIPRDKAFITHAIEEINSSSHEFSQSATDALH